MRRAHSLSPRHHVTHSLTLTLTLSPTHPPSPSQSVSEQRSHHARSAKNGLRGRPKMDSALSLLYSTQTIVYAMTIKAQLFLKFMLESHKFINSKGAPSRRICQPLPATVSHCQPLSATVSHCRSLSVAVSQWQTAEVRMSCVTVHDGA